jgi:hypothetical protein
MGEAVYLGGNTLFRGDSGELMSKFLLYDVIF